MHQFMDNHKFRQRLRQVEQVRIKGQPAVRGYRCPLPLHLAEMNLAHLHTDTVCPLRHCVFQVRFIGFIRAPTATICLLFRSWFLYQLRVLMFYRVYPAIGFVDGHPTDSQEIVQRLDQRLSLVQG